MKKQIKKLFRTFIHLVNIIFIWSMVAGAIALAAYAGWTVYQHEKTPQTVEDVEVTEEVQPEPVKAEAPKKTSVQEAESMLQEATKKLDAEEKKLLDEIKTIKETADAEVQAIREKAEAETTARETKIEEINTIRVSF